MRYTVWTRSELEHVIGQALAAAVLAIDFETCPSEHNRPATRAEFGASIAGVALAWIDAAGEKSSAYIAYGHYRGTRGNSYQLNPEVCKAAIGRLLEGFSGPVAVANATMELSFMLAEGWHWPHPGMLHDVQVMARVLNRGVGFKELIGLKELANKHLGRKHEGKNDLDTWLTTNRYKPGADIWRAPVAIASQYAQDDAMDTLELYLLWIPLLSFTRTEWWWYRAPNSAQRVDLYEMEMEVAERVAEVSISGMRYDRAMCERRTAAAHALQDAAAEWVKVALGAPVNPGSTKQLRGILFTAMGLKIDIGHVTDSLRKAPSAEQDKVFAAIEAVKPGEDGRYAYPPHLIDYASLDADALHGLMEAYPQHGDLLFMLLVYRKCQTALMWFESNRCEFSLDNAPDCYWDLSESSRSNQIYHRLRSVGAVSGRMIAKDYNGQQAVKRMKMLIDFTKLSALLADVFGEEKSAELMAMFDTSSVRNGDEAKMSGRPVGGKVVDFSVRAMFIPRKGKNFRSHDLSQVEMRGFAHYTGNPMLCGGYGKAMTSPEVNTEMQIVKRIVDGEPLSVLSGLRIIGRFPDADRSQFDIHRFIAEETDITRKDAKGVNFGLVYGMGKKKLARQLSWTQQRANKFFAKYQQRLPEVEQVQDAIKTKLRTRGYVFDPYGRRYHLTPDRAYIGLNRLIQGWAASAFKQGFIRTCAFMASAAMGGKYDPVMRRRRMDQSRVLNLVHDENLSEIPFELDTVEVDLAIRSCMTAFHNLKVPLASSSERGTSWDDAEPVIAPEVSECL